MRRRLISIVSLAFLASTVASTGGSAGATTTERSTYLITFVDGTNSRAEAAQLRAQNFTVSHVYENLFPGVAVELPAAAAEALARNPRVALIEPDAVVTISGTQTGATWGLDRVDQRALPLNTTFSYPTSAGSGVEVHVIDTGVLSTHVDLTGRVNAGYDAFGGTTQDCNGHGTHVAGTSAGTQWGLAKSAKIVAVRVLDCSGSGTLAGVIAGMDWVAANHKKPAVANMSLGSPASSTVDNGVAQLVSAGVTVVVAAGNSNANACNYSPARAASAITVGSTTASDTRSSFSNFGSCVDIFAPGSSITSAWFNSTTATNTISGTSMASPHVAGAAAVILGESPSLTPSQVASQLVNTATTGVVVSAGTGSPNRLLYSQTGPVEPQPLSVSTSSLPNATINVSYSTALSGSGGTAPYTWTVKDNTSPFGVSSSGVVSGIGTAAGTYTLTAIVTDSLGATAERTMNIRVLAPPASFSKLSPTTGTTGVSRSSARLTWAASTFATSYQVCLSTSTTCTSWQDLGNTTTATASSLRSRTTYYWQVRALNADGTTVASGGTWRFTTAR